MHVERTFLQDRVDEEICIELPDEELPGVHRKAVQDIAQNKVRFLSVAECCEGELEGT